MIRRWGVLCIDCRIGIDLGRVVLNEPDVSVIFELFEGREQTAGVERISSFVLSHAGHHLTIVDVDTLVSGFEDANPAKPPVRWTKELVTEMHVGSDEWTLQGGGRLVMDFLEQPPNEG